MDNFDKLYKQLMEAMTAGGAGMFGGVDNGSTANQIGGGKDTYAPNNMTNPFVFGKKKKKFQKRDAKIAM